MANNPKIKEIGVKFGQGQDPTKGGRPKKIYTILKETGYSKDDIRTAFGELAFYNMKQLKEVVEKEDTPAIVLVVATALRKAIQNGDYSKIKEIIEQVIGKSTQLIDANMKVNDLKGSIPIDAWIPKKND